jgi:hypothetical protein
VKDYYGYHTDSKTKLLNDSRKLFELQKEGFEGVTALIDGFEYEIIKQNHTNPFTKYTDEFIIMCDLDIPIHQGSLVIIENTNNLVVSTIVINPVYKSTKITECNNTLTIQTGLTETIIGYDSIGRPIIQSIPTYESFPCIETSGLNVNRRSDLNEPINLPFGRTIITIPYTDKVEIDMEFEMNGMRYKIIDMSFSRTGLIDFMGDRKV